MLTGQSEKVMDYQQSQFPFEEDTDNSQAQSSNATNGQQENFDDSKNKTEPAIGYSIIVDGISPYHSPSSFNYDPQSFQLPLLEMDAGESLEVELARKLKAFAVQLLALGHINGVGVQALRLLQKTYFNSSVADPNQLGRLEPTFGTSNDSGKPSNSTHLRKGSIWEDSEENIFSFLKKNKVRDAERIAKTIKTEQDELQAVGQQQYEWLCYKGYSLITPLSPLWPRQLLNVPGAPDWLFIEGKAEALKEPLVGVVGTRTPSNLSLSLSVTSQLAAIIASKGLGIVSGLADGIDNVAHRTGLNYGVPQVAVLGTGLDIFYPSETRATRHELIKQGGAVVSEYLPGTNVNRAQFVERNRIQAGLSTVLVPIEGRLNSGTAHTVDFARRYKRPVFGVTKGDVVNTNELNGFLQSHHYPIFDLGKQADIASLEDWLRKTIGEALWPNRSYPLIKENVFRSVLKTIDNLIQYVPMTEADLEWFQNEIRQRYLQHRTSQEEF